MATCFKGSINLEGLKSHKCSLCERCLVCHHCLLAKGYLRNKEADDSDDEVDAVLDAILKNHSVEEPPRYILVGPNNEILERKPNVVYLSPVDGLTTNDLENEVQEPVAVQEPLFYDCEICQKTFTSERDFTIHKIYHSTEEKHVCKVCHQQFAYSYQLIKHSINHNNKPCFVCEYCKRQYPSEQKLKIHLRKHTGSKPFDCNICGKAFKESGTLKAHIMIHTDERPFQCEECGRSFRFKLKLERHNWIHTGIKPFSCIVCEKTFRHKCNLKTHLLRSHKVEAVDDPAD